LLIGLKIRFLTIKLLVSNPELKIFFVAVKVLYWRSKYKNVEATISRTAYANLGVLPGAILAI